jgi:two-component system phosphate regulon response regulator OmpR
MNYKILVVDDDTRLRNLLTKYLNENGFDVSNAKDAFDAEEKLTDDNFDLLVVDVMMPNKTGVEFVKNLREKSKVPVLMLTAMGEIDDRIAGLESGADDYLQKPFEPKELLLRINSILKRVKPKKNKNICSFGNYEFDMVTKKLMKGDEFVYSTEAEADILMVFCKNINKPLTREKISEMCGGELDERSVDVQITRMRKKLEKNSKQPQFLKTQRGVGYILKNDNE